MATPLTLTLEEYEALIAFAREGARASSGQVSADKARNLDLFLRQLEKRNGLRRDGLWVQWTEAEQPLPPNTRFPETWPPTLRLYIELTTRLVSKADVLTVLAARAKKPVSVLVTSDPGAQVGWTEIDQHFPTG